jgi:hypothetical protein
MIRCYCARGYCSSSYDSRSGINRFICAAIRPASSIITTAVLPTHSLQCFIKGGHTATLLFCLRCL